MKEIQRRFVKAMERRLDDKPVQFVFGKSGSGMSDAFTYPYTLSYIDITNPRADYADVPAHPTLLLFNRLGLRK